METSFFPIISNFPSKIGVFHLHFWLTPKRKAARSNRARDANKHGAVSKQ